MSSVSEALDRAVEHLDLKPQDEATVALARRYAKALDGGDESDLGRIGPLLNQVLRELGASPAGRVAILKGGAQDERPTSNPLDELRAKRAARA